MASNTFLQQTQQRALSMCGEPRRVILPSRNSFAQFCQKVQKNARFGDAVHLFSSCGLDLSWNDFKDLKFNYCSKIFYHYINVHFEIPLGDIIELHNYMQQNMFIKYKGQRTLIPLNCVFPLLKSKLNSLYMKNHSEPLDFLKENLGKLFAGLKGLGIQDYAIFLYVIFVDHDLVSINDFKYSSEINSKICLTQLADYIGWFYNHPDPDNLDYTSRYIAEIFASFICCNLHFTNPLAISESEFFSDMLDYFTAIAVFRPRMYNDVEGKVYNEYTNTAQLKVDTTVNIDKNFSDVLSQVTLTFQDVIKSLDAAAASAVSSLRQKFSTFLTICYNLFRYATGALQAQDAFVNIIGLLLSSSIPDNLINDLHRIYKAVMTDKPAQSACSVESFCKLFAISAFVLFVRHIPDDKAVNAFISKLDRVPKAINGLEMMWSKFDVITSTIWPWIETTILQKENKFPTNILLDEVIDWSSELEELMEICNRHDIKKDIATLNRASRMYSRGIRLMKHCSAIKLNRANTDLIARLLPAAKLLADDCMKSGAQKSKLRQEPTIVWFCGGSGAGKTGLSYPFIMDMMRTFGPVPKTWQQDIYARFPETEYWDGYVDQEYILFDDAFQIKDSQLKPNPELFELVRLGNSFPYMLHMAAIEEKNNTFASPKLILLTSNLQEIRVESLNCSQAVTRRINFAFRVTTHPDYALKYTDKSGNECVRLNAAKARMESGKVLNFDVYEFELFDAESTKTIKSGLTYNEVVALVQQHMKSSFEFHQDVTDFLDEYRSQDIGTLVDLTESKDIENTEDADTETVAHISEESHPLTTRIAVNTAAYGFANSTIPWAFRTVGRSLYDTYHNIRHVYRREAYIIDSIWDIDNYGTREKLYMYYSLQSRKIRDALEQERLSMKQVLNKTLGASWIIFKACCAASVVAFSAYMCFKSVKQLKNELIIPKHIRDEKELFKYAEKANACISKNCAECSMCRYNKNESLCVKWYTQCTCCAINMENTNKFNQMYANSLHNHKPTKKFDKISPQVLLEMVEQIINCDCEDCNVCCDKELQHKFVNVASCYGVSCICVLSRLNQNFALCELLSLIKFCGDQNKGIIKNKVLLNMYNNMSSDIKYFDNSEEGMKLNNQLLEYQSNLYSQNVKVSQKAMNVKYQSIYDNKLGQRAQKAATVRYQGSEEIVQNLLPTFQRKAPEDDLSSDTITNCVVLPNTLYMIGHKLNQDGKEVERPFGNILFVSGRIALMPYHYYVVFFDNDFTDVSLYSYTRMTQKIPISALTKTFRYEGKDAILVEFPPIVNDYKNIVKHFIDVDDYPRVANCPATLARLSYNDHRVVPDRYSCSSISVSEVDSVNAVTIPGVKQENSIIRTRHYYGYKMPTRAGDCGAGLIVFNSAVQGKILGIHNSGSPGLTHGNAVALNRQLIEKGLKEFSSFSQYAYDSIPLTKDLDALADAGSFLIHDFHEKELISAAVATNLAPSPCHGELITSPNMPGKLRPFKNSKGLDIDPMALQRKKYGVPRPYLEQDLVDSIAESMKSLYYKEGYGDPDYYKRPLSTEQAIIGIDGDPYVNAINRSTAPGYPYTFHKKGLAGKKLWFGSDQEYDLSRPECIALMQDVENLKLMILDNKRPEVVWIDTLKDAKIPKEKVDIGKTRLFTAAPLHYVIAMREMCLPFVAHCAKNRISNSIAVGTNPSSPEWSLIAQRLMEKGDKVIAGDYSNFDGTLPCQLVLAGTEIITDWYIHHWDEVISHGGNIICGRELEQDEFREYCMKLYYECVHHLHIMNYENGTLLYNVRNGIPSGCPVTAILNSIVNHMALAYCWMKLHKDTDRENMTSFFESCSSIFYGDDFIMNIREDALSTYNQETITATMKQYLDMDMTDEAKTGNVVIYRTLSEVSFLKRRFRWEDSICEYVAPLDIDVVLDSTNWVRRGNEHPTRIVLSTLESAIRELAMHPTKVDLAYRNDMISLGIRLANKLPGRVFVHDSRQVTLRNIKNDRWSCDMGF